MKSPKIYKPQTARVIPWDKIEDYYANLIANGLHLQSMLALVQFIKSTGLSKKLFGYTSMHKLILTIYDPPEWNREALHVEFDSTSKKWHFKYHSKPFEQVETERIYTEEMGIAKFSQYLDWMKW